MEARWQFYPKYKKIPDHLEKVVEVFENNMNAINSQENTFSSNEVLEILRKDLESRNFQVEKSKKKEDKIKIPVLYKENGTIAKSFDLDAYNEEKRTMIEVEAGAAVANNLFLLDLLKGCLFPNVDYVVIAVRISRTIGEQQTKYNDFLRIRKKYLDTIYASEKFKLPLEGVLLIGY